MKKLNVINCFLALAMTIFTFNLHGQENKKEHDRLAIKSMVGCFDVQFMYTETFAPEVDYEKAYDYTSSARELAMVIDESEDRIVIQHL